MLITTVHGRQAAVESWRNIAYDTLAIPTARDENHGESVKAVFGFSTRLSSQTRPIVACHRLTLLFLSATVQCVLPLATDFRSATNISLLPVNRFPSRILFFFLNTIHPHGKVEHKARFILDPALYSERYIKVN